MVFDTTANDTTAPTVVAQVPAAGSNGVAVGTAVTATFSETVVASSVAWSSAARAARWSPATTAYDAGSSDRDVDAERAARDSTTYTATVSGARDAANNTMTPVTWTFTTAAPPPPPPDQGPGGPIAVVTSAHEPVLEVPGRDPADRRAERVRDHRRRHAVGSDTRHLRRCGPGRRPRDAAQATT